jgi:predicted metal-binding transcription factor (methanogenesis marker protein 9)
MYDSAHEGGICRGRQFRLLCFCALLVRLCGLQCIMDFMSASLSELQHDRFAVVETAMTLHAELMLLCARIGYSPPASL